ncbi:MAG: type II toxin-antitoxin system RelE/ParE family toxin [Candidatus Binatia bacterium]
MTSQLPIKVARRAAREIAEACEWWDANRPAAPKAMRQEIARVFRLIAHQPGIGARALNARLVGVRRVHLSRVHYHLYYRVRSNPAAVEILALWHTSRGTSPRV